MKMSRRNFLEAGVAASALAISGCASVGGERTLRPIGLQMYMLGDEIRADVHGALRSVAAIGYREVELSSFYGLTSGEMRRALADVGLTCPSLHVPMAPLGPSPLTLEDIPTVVREARALGATYVGPSIFAFPPSFQRRAGEPPQQMIGRMAREMTPTDWTRTADTLNQKGAELRREGLKLIYHNHNLEFLPLGNGTALDFLFAQTDPALVFFEIDVGWVLAGGGDPAALIRRHASRIKLLHVKDLNPTPPNQSIEINATEVGSGVQDWPAILAATKAAGVEHYFVEQEPPYARPRLESARLSFQYLQGAFRQAGL